jgi:hypothetical protein
LIPSGTRILCIAEPQLLPAFTLPAVSSETGNEYLIVSQFTAAKLTYVHHILKPHGSGVCISNMCVVSPDHCPGIIPVFIQAAYVRFPTYALHGCSRIRQIRNCKPEKIFGIFTTMAFCFARKYFLLVGIP